MQKIHLVMDNPSLSGALIEQLSFAGLAFDSVSKDLSAALNDPMNSVIVFDDSALDKRNLKVFSETDDQQKKRILLFGQFPESLQSSSVAELFPKPIRLGFMLSRLQFHLEVVPRLKNVTHTFGSFRLEPQSRQIIVKDTGHVIRLTEKETALLEYLGQCEKPVEREELLGAVWGYDARIDTHTLETHIYQLRRKLDPDLTGLNILINEKGGYRLKRD